MNFTTHPDEGLEGILWSYRGGWLTLTDLTPSVSGVEGARLPGDAVIHRSQIKFLQVLP